MRYTTLVLLFAACSTDPAAESSDDLDQGKATPARVKQIAQPVSDPDDEALLKTDREHIIAPSGDALAPTGLVALFPDGRGDWNLGDARAKDNGVVELTRYVSTCKKDVCNAFTPDVVVLSSQLNVSVNDKGEVWLTQLTRDNQVLTTAQLTGTKTLVTLVSHVAMGAQSPSGVSGPSGGLVQADVDAQGSIVTGEAEETHRFLVEVRSKSLTLETLVKSREGTDGPYKWGWAIQATYDVAAQPDRPFDGSQLLPVLPKHTLTCTQSPATADQLKAYFRPDEKSIALPNGEDFGFTRECHALTGCSEWTRTNSTLFKTLQTDGDTYSLKTSFDEVFALSNAAVKKDDVDITFGAACATGTAYRAISGSHHNALELFNSAIMVRGGSTSDK